MMEGKPKKIWKGESMRCKHCGCQLTPGTSKCPSCDHENPYNYEENETLPYNPKNDGRKK